MCKFEASAPIAPELCAPRNSSPISQARPLADRSGSAHLSIATLRRQLSIEMRRAGYTAVDLSEATEEYIEREMVLSGEERTAALLALLVCLLREQNRAEQHTPDTNVVPPLSPAACEQTTAMPDIPRRRPLGAGMASLSPQAGLRTNQHD